MVDYLAKSPLITEDFFKLQNVLDEAKSDYNDDPISFYKSKIFKMGRFIRLYSELMTHLNVKLKEDLLEELDSLDFNLKKDTFVERNRVFLDEWNKFLEEIESKANQNVYSGLEVGQELPKTISDNKIYSQILPNFPNEFTQMSLNELHDSFRTDKKITNSNQSHILLIMLRHFAWLPWREHVKELQLKANEFLSLNCQVILVSFGEPKGAYRWLMENHVVYSDQHFNMITDHERNLYKLFGLPNSYYKVWNTETLIYYAEQLIKIGKLPGAYQDIDDDPHQMGGNFMLEFNSLEKKFKLIYSYKSKNPPDRPSAKVLLDFLKSKN